MRNTSERHSKREIIMALIGKIVLKVLIAAALIALLWATSPTRLFLKCRGDDAPRYCVD